MKLITRDTDYALRAICYIVKAKDKIITVSELVAKLKIPRPFLRKILQVLNKEGILCSSKGKNGGFTLIISPENILLVDLIKIFQGTLKLNECFFKKKICPDENKCTLRRIITGIEKDVIRRLKQININTLLD